MLLRNHREMGGVDERHDEWDVRVTPEVLGVGEHGEVRSAESLLYAMKSAMVTLKRNPHTDVACNVRIQP